MKQVPKWLGRAFFLFWICLSCYPFLWMFLSSFKQNTELFRPDRLWPQQWDFFAWQLLWKGELISLKQGLWNALYLSFGQTFLAAFLGYSYSFFLYFTKGRVKLGLTVLAVAAVVVPAQVMAIPLVQISQRLGLYDNAWSVLLTGGSTGLGVLYFIQAFKRIPKTLLDAAAIDGAGSLQLYGLFFQESKSHLLGFLLLFFMLCWHAHLLPLLLLHSEANLPLPLSMRSLLDSSLRFPRAVLMAASLFLIFPPLIFFMFGYRSLKNSLGEVLSDPDV